MRRFINRYFIFMPFACMIALLFLGIFLFASMTPLLYVEGKNFPYFDDYYEVQGVVESFQKHGSAKTYWVTLTLEDGSEYFIDPDLRTAYAEWRITHAVNYVKPGKKVILEVFDFSNGPYTPAIASLKCDDMEFFSLDTSIYMYRELYKESICILLGLQLFSLLVLVLIGTCSVLQVKAIEYIARKRQKIPSGSGILSHVIWMPSWILVIILVIAYVFFGMGLHGHKQCIDIFNIPKLSTCEKFEGSVKNISVTPDKEFLQFDFDEEKVYLPVKYSKNNLQIQALYNIQKGTTLNVSVYQLPHKGGMISGILELSDSKNTYIAYEDAKILYYKMAEISRLYPSKYYIGAAILYIILAIIVLIRKYLSGERIIVPEKYKNL